MSRANRTFTIARPSKPPFTPTASPPMTLLTAGFPLGGSTIWSDAGIGVAGPYVGVAGGDYEKWNQSGIGVAGGHWIHISGNPEPQAQTSSMPFGRPQPDLLRRLAQVFGDRHGVQIDLVRRRRFAGRRTIGPMTVGGSRAPIRRAAVPRTWPASTGCCSINTDASATMAKPITPSPTATSIF
jgi:hypothetical protein